MDALLELYGRTNPPHSAKTSSFLSNRDSHPLRGTFSRDVLGKAVKHAGLTSRRVTWLTLRHTAASWMFDAGWTLLEMQQRLGHRSPTLMAEIYAPL